MAPRPKTHLYAKYSADIHKQQSAQLIFPFFIFYNKRQQQIIIISNKLSKRPIAVMAAAESHIVEPHKSSNLTFMHKYENPSMQSYARRGRG